MNKIKGSSSAVKMKYLLFVFAAAVLVALPTRVFQLLGLVDTTNGFFKENNVTIPVLYGVVVFFGFLFLVLSYLSKEVPSPKLPVGKNPVLGIASFVMIAGLGLDMFKILTDILPANQGGSEIFLAILKWNIERNGGMFTLLHFVFAFFAIIYFLVFAISHLNGKASYKEFKLLALSPLCWAMTVLVKNLTTAISFIRVSELLFEIFMFVFVMLFFITFARISSGVFTEDSMWGIYGYGFTASLLAAIVTIPRIVMMLVKIEPVEGYEFNLVHLSTMVFILAYIFASLGVGFKEGIKARREVSEIELPSDAEVITKKDDIYESFTEETAVEETAVEETAVEETAVEETAVEETVVEETVVEETFVEETEVVETEVEETAVEETIVVETEVVEAVEETIVVETEVENVVVEAPVIEEKEEVVKKDDVSGLLENYETIDYSDDSVQENKQKKSKSLFKKAPKNKAKPVEENAEEDELKPISLAELKNRKNN